MVCWAVMLSVTKIAVEELRAVVDIFGLQREAVRLLRQQLTVDVEVPKGFK